MCDEAGTFCHQWKRDFNSHSSSLAVSQELSKDTTRRDKSCGVVVVRYVTGRLRKIGKWAGNRIEKTTFGEVGVSGA